MLWKGLGSPALGVPVKKDILLVYVLFIFFGILAGRYGNVVVRGREVRVRGPGSILGCDFPSF